MEPHSSGSRAGTAGPVLCGEPGVRSARRLSRCCCTVLGPCSKPGAEGPGGMSPRHTLDTPTRRWTEGPLGRGVDRQATQHTPVGHLWPRQPGDCTLGPALCGTQDAMVAFALLSTLQGALSPTPPELSSKLTSYREAPLMPPPPCQAGAPSATSHGPASFPCRGSCNAGDKRSTFQEPGHQAGQ